MTPFAPLILQRLKAADILQKVGLARAAQAQEYRRLSTLQAGKREQATLNASLTLTLHPAHAPEDAPPDLLDSQNFEVSISLAEVNWTSTCTCGEDLCNHALALLYHWLAQPELFATEQDLEPMRAPSPFQYTFKRAPTPVSKKGNQEFRTRTTTPSPSRPNAQPENPAQIPEIPTTPKLLLSLSVDDLQRLSQAFQLHTSSEKRSELAQLLYQTLQNKELVSRFAASLKKAARHLLVLTILSGGLLQERDLQEVYERFQLPQPQFAHSLLTLRDKGFLYPLTYKSNRPQADRYWYVPTEIQQAIQISIPVAQFESEEQLKTLQAHADDNPQERLRLWLTERSARELLSLRDEGIVIRSRAELTEKLFQKELVERNQQARATLLTLFAYTPATVWVSLRHWARFLYRLNPTFLRGPQPTQARWWLERKGRTLYANQAEDWLIAEYRYLNEVLRRLQQWGFLDLLENEQGEIMAFRLSEGSSQILKKRLSPSPEATPPRATLSIQYLPVLRVPSKILLDLQDDQTLQPFLQAYAASDEQLIPLTSQQLPALLAILQERGIGIEQGENNEFSQ